ncbi:hypothetical protein Vadar_024625 [Vaccinium darrowii]|uniref:Uncharacterized protein n=1 Tax=Vaccinium darrowii TaxID=229202 RepID=A0ACB7XTS0_9ERIC|nr:hypothetical protein Vadar_024625 [Vaccinium darrowii]
MDSCSSGYGSHSYSNPSSSHGEDLLSSPALVQEIFLMLGEFDLLQTLLSLLQSFFQVKPYPARCKQEEKAKEKLLIDATSIKKRETKQLAYAAKVDDDMISQKAENEMLKYKECIEELESKISELRLEYESSKVAALEEAA